MNHFPKFLEFCQNNRGVVAIVTALVLPVLIGIAGLAIDIGYLLFVQADLQAAADASALAAASSLDDEATATDLAIEYAEKNRPQADYGNILVASDVEFGNWDDATRTFTVGAASTNAVRVTTRRARANGNPVSMFFAQLFGFSTRDVMADAIAARDNTSGGDCVLALDPTASRAVNIHGTADLSLNCGIAVASTQASQAFAASGTPTINATSICVAGGASASANVTFVTATPSTGCATPPDPLSGLAAPEESANPCDHNNYSLSGSGGATTLSPGVYCGGIAISGSNKTINFLPGVYVLKGGGMQVTGSDNTLVGTGGVLFYNTTSNGNDFDDVSFGGGNTIEFTAPTSGDYSGVLFFQDPSAASAAANVRFRIQGNATMNLDGTIYFPNHDVEYSGTGSISKTCATKIIAATVDFGGTSDTAGASGAGCASDGVEIGTAYTIGLKA